ncbi:phosphatidylinositol N-acetylglucosaminyltransferase [Penicillium brasilianum]|uniref:Phosphatidylinositol N-acetylglucosaminyltransferase n=1 Tax=Penicillium brasilianum TaxID=104259 RepID=A0A1S9RR04_PENBI|nr:phosphatidylinositol N-acetylglucosaminyltransferase [Penicillium brasilianum]
MPGRLTVQRPTPTTVSFTVSNAPRRSSSPAKVLFGLQILLRALLFCCVIVVGITRLRRHFFEKGSLFIISWEDVWSSSLGAHVCRRVDSYNPWVAAIVSAVVLYGVFRRGYTEESLLVIRGFGIQTSTSSSTYLSTAATRFIPTTQIQDIVIHEAFKGFEVRFYLAVIVEGEPGVLVVFPQMLPKREILEEVWRGSRRCLYDAKS